MTESKEDQILQMRQNGYTYEEIASSLHCSRGTISRVLKSSVNTMNLIFESLDELVPEPLVPNTVPSTDPHVLTLTPEYIRVPGIYKDIMLFLCDNYLSNYKKQSTGGMSKQYYQVIQDLRDKLEMLNPGVTWK